MRRLIVLRPEPGASETKSHAEALGLDPVFAVPLFSIEPLGWEAPEPAGFDALLLTSANAIRQGGDQLQKLRGLSAHCVGQATADAARGAGFDIASVGKAGVQRLLGSIESDQRLLHLAGEDRTEIELAKQEITIVPVYRAAELPPPENFDLANGAVVLVHSRRAGARLAQLTEAGALDRSSIAIAAISDSAAAAAGGGWELREAAEKPDERSLLELAHRMCNTAEQ
jgi:uroporphyrinogen-III synthase